MSKPSQFKFSYYIRKLGDWYYLEAFPHSIERVWPFLQPFLKARHYLLLGRIGGHIQEKLPRKLGIRPHDTISFEDNILGTVVDRNDLEKIVKQYEFALTDFESLTQADRDVITTLTDPTICSDRPTEICPLLNSMGSSIHIYLYDDYWLEFLVKDKKILIDIFHFYLQDFLCGVTGNG